MHADFRLLIINPGSKSSHIAIYDGELCIFERRVTHPDDECSSAIRVVDQTEFRTRSILELLDYEGINLSYLTAVCGKGGLLKPIEGGTYKVNAAMLYDLKTARYGEHVSNLGGIIAYEIASGLNIDAYIVDPVVVDELEDIARISGLPEIPRKSIFHALNQKAAARKAALELRQIYEELNLIVIHMGRGITIGAHQRGKVIDVNNGLDGDGPFTPERSGTIPTGDLVRLCFSCKYTMENLQKEMIGNGGLIAYLRTKNLIEIEARMKNGDAKAKEVYEAMAYQIAKEIGAMSTVLLGEIHAIVFTGNLANASHFTELIAKRVDWIADTLIFPGENELQALNEGVLRVLRKEELDKTYQSNEE